MNIHDDLYIQIRTNAPGYILSFLYDNKVVFFNDSKIIFCVEVHFDRHLLLDCSHKKLCRNKVLSQIN